MINFKKVVSMAVMLSLMLGACGKSPARRDEEINSLAGALTDNSNGGAIVKKEGTFSECWEEVNPLSKYNEKKSWGEYFGNLFLPNPTWSALWGTVIPLISLAIAEVLIYRNNTNGKDLTINHDGGVKRYRMATKINDGSTKWWQKLWYGTRSTRWWHRAIKINVCGWLAAGWVTGQTVAKDSAGHDWLGRACIGIVYGSLTGLSTIALPALAVVGGEYLPWWRKKSAEGNAMKWEREIKTMIRSFTFGMLAGGMLAGGIATKNSVAAGDRWWTTLGKGFWQSAAGFLSLGLTTGAIGSVVGIGGMIRGWRREKKAEAERHKNLLERLENDRKARENEHKEERAQRAEALQAKRAQDINEVNNDLKRQNWETFEEQKEILLQARMDAINAQYGREEYVNEQVLPAIDELNDLLKWAEETYLYLALLSKDDVANVRNKVTQKITNMKEVVNGERNKVMEYRQASDNMQNTAKDLLPALEKGNATEELVEFVAEFASEGSLKDLQERVNKWDQEADNRLNPFKNYVQDTTTRFAAGFVDMMNEVMMGLGA